ncbi:hypothetical protein L7F22_063509 [Adiantum nelumboides]|nr:hypothetical protein [Adiantum nelumboides]
MTSLFWRGLFENMGTTLKFSSSFHPQTDGQSEEANSTVLDLLKCYVSEHKGKWEQYLPLVEYAYNNTVHSSTGKAPFEIVEGGKKVPPILHTKDKIFEANKYVQDMDEMYKKVKVALEKTQAKQKKAADSHRCEVVFSLGDWVKVVFVRTYGLVPYRTVQSYGILNCESLDEYNVKFWDAFLPVSFFKIVPLAEQIEKYCCGLPKESKSNAHRRVMNMAQLMENAEVVDDSIQDKPDEDGFKTHCKESRGKLFAARGNVIAMLTVPPFKNKPFIGNGMYLLSVHQKRVAIELVGKDKIENKQNRLEDLTSASLVYKGVVSSGELEGVLPNLKELDLTGNLLPDWQAVNLICDQLPALRLLDLSRNRIQLNSDSFPGLVRLQILVLNSCQMSWGQVEILKRYLPELEELHLCGNKISAFEVEDGCDHVEGFKHLRLLNLENNCIQVWEELLKLSDLESLEQLQVSHNGLKQIYYPEGAGCVENQRPFMSLRCLLLAGNAIDDWGSIDALNLFPKLTEIRLSNNPLTDLHAGGAPRFLLVARLANISVLNGSEIRQRERKDSEIRYVHYVMNTMPTCEEAERLRVHPRFLELKKMYDLDEEQPHLRKDTGATKMADNLRAITIVCVAPSVGEKAPSVKKLPLSTTIGKLKLVCESIFKVKASKQRLYLREQDAPVPVPLNDDLESLRDVGVGLETTILVDELGI